ncbi:hypothetical protein ACFPM0_14470 [Pseudonocardia sulfidoxydans]|uniref:hypothetical protein n=1 Tax=Pseudonocardia sulfidoxydans TaxID=54011 RepID=UPI00361E472A
MTRLARSSPGAGRQPVAEFDIRLVRSWSGAGWCRTRREVGAGSVARGQPSTTPRTKPS